MYSQPFHQILFHSFRLVQALSVVDPEGVPFQCTFAVKPHVIQRNMTSNYLRQYIAVRRYPIRRHVSKSSALERPITCNLSENWKLVLCAFASYFWYSFRWTVMYDLLFVMSMKTTQASSPLPYICIVNRAINNNSATLKRFKIPLYDIESSFHLLGNNWYRTDTPEINQGILSS